VKSTFKYSNHVAALDISVSTTDGVVKLAGKVDNDAEMALAVELAGNVRGVKRVDSSALTL
jgi:osmotically-inducible protein OsmY